MENTRKEQLTKMDSRTEKVEPEHIAFLGDIHGNYPALEAVLDDLPDTITEIICLGDIVGDGAQSRNCVTTVQAEVETSIRGEFDTYASYSHTELDADRLTEEIISHTTRELTETEQQWLQQLPKRDIHNGDILICHSHPDPQYEGSYIQQRDLRDLTGYMDKYDVSIIVFAHTHTQQHLDLSTDTEDGELIFNPGSVGYPRDRNSDASYALLDTNKNEVEFCRVSYDLSETIQAIRDAGLPDELINRIAEAR